MSCKICPRKPAKNGFCQMHLKAYETIVEKYAFWRKPLKISWKEYLSEITQNSLTGEWTKEIANYLFNNEGTKSVKKS